MDTKVESLMSHMIKSASAKYLSIYLGNEGIPYKWANGDQYTDDEILAGPLMPGGELFISFKFNDQDSEAIATCQDFIEVPESKSCMMDKICNKLNTECPWVKLYMEDGSLKARAQSVIFVEMAHLESKEFFCKVREAMVKAIYDLNKAIDAGPKSAAEIECGINDAVSNPARYIWQKLYEYDRLEMHDYDCHYLHAWLDEADHYIKEKGYDPFLMFEIITKSFLNGGGPMCVPDEDMQALYNISIISLPAEDKYRFIEYFRMTAGKNEPEEDVTEYVETLLHDWQNYNYNYSDPKPAVRTAYA